MIWGNIDPKILLKSKDHIKKSVENLKKHVDEEKHIYNLGHGVIKTTPPEKSTQHCDRGEGGYDGNHFAQSKNSRGVYF